MARGMCQSHYDVYRRNGMPPLPDAVAKFWAQIDLETAPGCWLWTGYVAPDGYGKIWADGREKGVHRFAYELLVGPVGEESLDHLCHTYDEACDGGTTCIHRRCANPEHLEPCSLGENTRRGRNHNSRVTHCPSDHEYSPENTYISPSGDRRCKECNRERARRFSRRDDIESGEVWPEEHELSDADLRLIRDAFSLPPDFKVIR